MKIIKVFVWSIIVTLTFVCAFFIQLIQDPPRVGVKTRFVPQNQNKTETKSETGRSIVEKDFENDCDGRCKLVWKDEDGSEIILSETKHGGDYLLISQIKFYTAGDKSFLIFLKNAAEDSSASYEGTRLPDHYQVVLFDTKTKEKKVIFDPQKPVDGVTPDYSFYPGGLTLIGSEVYFSFTSARGIGETYYINLEDKELQAQKSTVNKGVIIKKWNRYWVIGREYGEGHGQFGNSSYASIDLNTKKLGQKIIEFGEEVGPFSDLLGVTKDGQAIRLESFGAYTDPEILSYAKILKKVWVHPLNDESSSSTLFAEGMIPQGVTEAFFNTNKNSLFFVGEKLFEYNFDTTQMVEKEIPQSLGGFKFAKLVGDERVCLETDGFIKSKIWSIEHNTVSDTIDTSCWIWEANQFPVGTPPQLQVVQIQ